jgi:Zn-dependent metalloprotease
MIRPCRCLNCITPPHLLKKLLENQDKDISKTALNTMLTTATLRGEREVRAAAGFLAAPAGGRRAIYDCRTSTILSAAVLARTETSQASTDASVNRAFDGLGLTRDFYKDVFDRDSLNGHGLRLDGYVHRGVRYQNAFWDGQQMVFGDGDGVVFTDFTKSIDVIAHELTHGITEFTANLTYHKQPGALNESISDVFGSLVKQWSLGQDADAADWLIGTELFTPGIAADALRSMKAPGTAYSNDLLGTDPQPDHMDRFVILPDTEEGDWAAVHINSGIPNKAFYLVAIAIGGNAWEAPGHIWYESLLASNESTQFQDFADTTYLKAGQLYGTDSIEQKSVASAWREVGIRITGVSTGPRDRRPGRDRTGEAGRNADTTNDGDTLMALTKHVETLGAQVKALARDVKALKEIRIERS